MIDGREIHRLKDQPYSEFSVELLREYLYEIFYGDNEWLKRKQKESLERHKFYERNKTTD